MARIRSVKPEFFDDPNLAQDLSIPARLLYIGLWTMCYDNWTMEYDPRKVKRTIFGYDDNIDYEYVDCLIDEIEGSGRAVRFEFEGRTCLYLPKCDEHQVINRPSKSPIPLPDSVSAQCGISDDSTLKGKERKGEERNHHRASFDEWWSHYPRKVGKIDAERAYARAMKQAEPNAILSALVAYPFSKDPQFIPHPATWLNQGRWMDEVPIPFDPDEVEKQRIAEDWCRGME